MDKKRLMKAKEPTVVIVHGRRSGKCTDPSLLEAAREMNILIERADDYNERMNQRITLVHMNRAQRREEARMNRRCQTNQK